MNKILNKKQISQKLTRIAHEIIEQIYPENTIFMGGIKGNGSIIAKELIEIIRNNSNIAIQEFEISLDKENPLDHEIHINNLSTSKEKEIYILVDDVVNSGKTMQYALTKLLTLPNKSIKTVTLVDRSYRRYPIKCDFVGLTLSTTIQDRVEVSISDDDAFAYLT